MGLGRFFSRVFGNSVVKTMAALAVTGFAPDLAGLVMTTLDAVLAAEAKFGNGAGDKKIEWVLDFAAAFTPRIIKNIEIATGRELVDEKLFEEAMRDLVNAIVKMLNAFGMLLKKTGA